MEVICQSRGTPLPRITWVRQDGHKWVKAEDVPGLRQVSDRYSELKCTTHYTLYHVYILYRLFIFYQHLKYLTKISRNIDISNYYFEW